MPRWCAAVTSEFHIIVCLTNGLAMSSTFLPDNLAFLFRNSAVIFSDEATIYPLLRSHRPIGQIAIAEFLRPIAQIKVRRGTVTRPKLILGPILFIFL